LDHVKNWHDRAKQLGGQDIEMILVGNKADVAENMRAIKWDEGDAMATDLGIQFIETSALSGENVEAAFLAMASTIKESVDKRGLTGVKASTMEAAGGVVLSTGERKTTLKERCGCY
jgi:GTPase SAR1 family protein